MAENLYQRSQSKYNFFQTVERIISNETEIRDSFAYTFRKYRKAMCREMKKKNSSQTNTSISLF